MSWRTGDSVVAEFTTRSSTGAVNADSLPTGTLVINGVDNGASVTVTNKAAGVYKASVTLPTASEGDLLQIRVAATVGGVSDNCDVWAGRTSYSLPYAAPAAANGLPTIGTSTGQIPTGIFSGMTSLPQWLGLMTGSQLGNSTARTEMRAMGDGSGTYNEASASLQALSAMATNVGLIQGAVLHPMYGLAGIKAGVDAIPTTDTSGVTTLLSRIGSALTISGGNVSAKLADAVTHGGASAVLQLERLIALSTTSGEPGIKATGNGSAPGIYGIGGAASGATPAGAGIRGLGGAASTTNGGLAGQGIYGLGGPGAATTNVAASGFRSEGGTDNGAGGGIGAVLMGTGTAKDLNAATNGVAFSTFTASGAVAFQSTFAVTGNFTAANYTGDAYAALATTANALPGQVTPSATPTLLAAIMQLFQQSTNPYEQDGSEQRLYNRAASVVHQKRTVSDDGTKLSYGPLLTGP